MRRLLHRLFGARGDPVGRESMSGAAAGPAAPPSTAPEAMIETCRLLLAGRLASDAAHDINNHLQVMMGNAELLRSGTTLSARERDRLTMIDEAGTAAMRACRALLDIAAADGAGRPGTGVGDLLEAERDVLARIAGDGTGFALDIAPSARASVPDPAAGEALATVLHALVLLARPVAGAGLTLRARLDEGTAARSGHGPDERTVNALTLQVDGGARTDGSSEAAVADTGEVEILAALDELVVGVGGRCRRPAPDLAGACRVTLPLQSDNQSQ